MKRNCCILDKVTIDRLAVLIGHHFKANKPRHFYCEKLGYSLAKVNLLCVQYVGMTLFQMIQARTIDEAKSLLLETDLSIKEITFVLGFKDQAYFGRFVKKWIGYAPQEYRDTIRVTHYLKS